MSSNDLSLKLDNLLQNDYTENFYSLISEIIDENREYISDLEQNLNSIFNILLKDINESNHERKMSFICLFFEILISENIDFVLYLERLLNLIIKTNIYSDENIKRIINICSNATINKKILLKK
jgi:predicted transcriptional regulator